MKTHIISLLFSLFILPAYADGFWTTVDYVIDGDTFVTDKGKHVRLLGINTPEMGRNGFEGQPFAKEAKLYLTNLINRKTVYLDFTKKNKADKYGRLLAFVRLEDGTNINETLLASGLAHVYTFPDTPFDATSFFNAEEKARVDTSGIWSLSRWRTIDAQEDVSKTRIGSFNLVEGKVIASKTVKDIIYLNFGTNWRTDFTVEIKKNHWENFVTAGIDPHAFYTGKTVRVRGFLKPVNGVLVTATHPAQLQIIK